MFNVRRDVVSGKIVLQGIMGKIDHEWGLETWRLNKVCKYYNGDEDTKEFRDKNETKLKLVRYFSGYYAKSSCISVF